MKCEKNAHAIMMGMIYQKQFDQPLHWLTGLGTRAMAFGLLQNQNTAILLKLKKIRRSSAI
jgi:hypothetical protein